MPKRNKLNELKNKNQTHGKKENEVEPQFISQLLGDKGNARFGTTDEEEYKNQLDAMDRQDLHQHATEVGVIPVNDRKRLKNTLIKEFKNYVRAYKVPKQKETKGKKLNKKEESILKRFKNQAS